jgi:hypothetical protein
MHIHIDGLAIVVTRSVSRLSTALAGIDAGFVASCDDVTVTMPTSAGLRHGAVRPRLPSQSVGERNGTLHVGS